MSLTEIDMFDTISLTEVNFEAYITLWARFTGRRVSDW